MRNRWSGEKIRPMEEKRKTLSARLARWAAELVLVFIGVYAAFWLNSYQQHQQEANRRDQILAALERTLREGIKSGRNSTVDEEREAAEFKSALDAGKMLPLHPFVFTTDYNPSDFATLLQSGGVELLDVETLTGVAQRRISDPVGTEPHGSLSKIKRRTNRAESGSGHFVLLRSDDHEIAKTFRHVSRSSAGKSEICSRPGSNAQRTAQTHSSGTAPVSQRTEDGGQSDEQVMSDV